ncbi:MAG TPA: FadR/GntR family transcriptional regulator [Deltaproteobacteria bacterium]|jgi:GntR family transcriptional repressor for pyruvate dehydrogenase complex|nr:FadR/GntR family transcriptional regulator [Deltaproteobacteria bacterium]
MMKRTKLPGLSRIEKSPDIPTLVMNQIIDLISQGKLKIGEKLPSEQEMTELFGISRISLREAMKLLEAKGYIESRDRKGKYVKSLTHNVKSSIEDLISVNHEKIWELLAVRRLIDSEAASLAAKNASKDQKKRFDKILERIGVIGTDNVLTSKEGGKLYSDFFDILADSTKNTIFVHLRDTIANVLTGAFPYSRKKLSRVENSSRDIVDQLLRIADAIGRKDPDAAKALTIEHIDYIEKSLRKVLKEGE